MKLPSIKFPKFSLPKSTPKLSIATPAIPVKAKKGWMLWGSKLREFVTLWGVKETIGTAAAAGGLAVAAPFPGTKGEGLLGRTWAWFKDAKEVPRGVLGSIGRIRLSDKTNTQGSGHGKMLFHDLALHANLSPSEFDGLVFGAAIAGASAVTLGAMEVSKHILIKHRLGDDTRIKKIPIRARKEIIHELVTLQESLAKEERDNLRPTIKAIERLIKGEGSVGTRHSGEGAEQSVQLVVNGNPAEALAALPKETRDAIDTVLAKHAFGIATYTDDAIKVAASGAKAEASYNRLVSALQKDSPAVAGEKNLDTLASGARPDPATMFGSQIQAMGGNTPPVIIGNLKQTVEIKNQTQELAATGQSKSNSLN